MKFYNLKKTPKGTYAIGEDGKPLFVKNGTKSKDMIEGGPYCAIPFEALEVKTIKGLTPSKDIDITFTSAEARMYSLSREALDRHVTRVSISLLSKQERLSVVATDVYIFSDPSEAGKNHRDHLVSKLARTLEAKYKCDVVIGLISISHFSTLHKDTGTLRAHFNYGTELEDFYSFKNNNTKVLLLDENGTHTKTKNVIKVLF